MILLDTERSTKLSKDIPVNKFVWLKLKHIVPVQLFATHGNFET